jgi:hypothetical protein
MVALVDIPIHPRLHPQPDLYFSKEPIKSAFEKFRNMNIVRRSRWSDSVKGLADKIAADAELVFDFF